jgi:hypothetical protein
MRHLLKTTLLSVLLLAVFVSATSAGCFLSSDMSMKDGKMAPCPYMGMTAVCNMTPFEHITAWQSAFAAIPVETAMMLLFVLFTLFGSIVLRHLFDPPDIARKYERIVRSRAPNTFALVTLLLGSALNPCAP